MFRDYYDILKIPSSAGAEQIHAAYRTLMQQYEPKRFYASRQNRLNQKIRLIGEAYDTLGDAKQKTRYDASYHQQMAQTQVNARQQRQRETLNKIIYWFALTIFVILAGKTFLTVLGILPVMLKIIIIAGLVWVLYQVWLGAAGKRRR